MDTITLSPEPVSSASLKIAAQLTFLADQKRKKYFKNIEEN